MSAPLETLHGLLEARSRSTPDRIAYTIIGSEDETVTYRQLWEASLDTAAALARSGVRRGDRVVLGLDTGLDFLAGLFGAMAIGAIAVPCYPPGSAGRGDRLRMIIEKPESRCSTIRCGLLVGFLSKDEHMAAWV